MVKALYLFYSTLVPIFLFSLPLGLTPFTINSKCCKQSKLKFAYSILLMMFINISTITSNYLNKSEDIVAENEWSLKRGFMLYMTYILDDYFSQTGLICGILFTCIFSKHTVNLLQFINAFDRCSEISLNVDINVEYRKSKIYSIIGLTLIGLFTMMLVITQIQMNLNLFYIERIGELFAYMVPNLINTCIIVQFCTIALSFKQRFSWLNIKMLELHKAMATDSIAYSIAAPEEKIVDSKEFRVRVQTKKLEKLTLALEDIRTKHYKLCEAAQELNKIYSLQILLIVLQDLITISQVLFKTGRFIFKNIKIKMHFHIYFGLYICSAIARVVALTLSGSSTISEAAKTSILLHLLMNVITTFTPKLKEKFELEILFCSLQFLHQRLKFTALRIFPLDATLLFSITGVVTTYLIVTAQFE